MNVEKLRDFFWQHLLLLISLFLLSFGVALCVRSNLGSSVISSAPYVLTLAGANGNAPGLSLGTYTNLLNILLVLCQIAILRRRFQPIQCLQLAVGIIFGILIDTSMLLTQSIIPENMLYKLATMLIGASIMAMGVAMEVRCASITMPGEGLPAAIAKMSGKTFGSVKIWVDVSLVILAVILEFVFIGKWMWSIVGLGTLFAMVYCGMAVKFISSRIGWFDLMLGYKPGFRRYLYGLANFVNSNIFNKK